MTSVQVLSFAVMSPSSCQATPDQKISVAGTESPLTISHQVFVPAALCPKKEQIFRGNQCTAPVHAMISLMREQATSVLIQRLNQDHVYVIFDLLLPADISSLFHCNLVLHGIFVWSV